MGPILASSFVDAPRERVFRLLADLAARPAFCDHFMRHYRLQRLDSTGVGASARFRVQAPRYAVWAEAVIAELDPPYLIRERGRCGRLDRVPTHTVWEVLEGAGRMAEVRVAFWTEPTHPLDMLRERLGAARWYRRQLAQALERLRELVEEEAEVPHVAVAGG
jgi:uncharacterized protein YndB with AHSA1/START domain